MKNSLIQLPAEVKEKIEHDAQNLYDKITENLEEQENPIAQLLVEWIKLYKEEKSTKWFLEHKHLEEKRDITQGYEELLAIQNDKIEELLTQLEMVKKQIR